MIISTSAEISIEQVRYKSILLGNQQLSGNAQGFIYFDYYRRILFFVFSFVILSQDAKCFIFFPPVGHDVRLVYS